ncbi:MAG: hypothetical protein ACE5GB_15205, partial [Acidimicrobiales bacterium]
MTDLLSNLPAPSTPTPGATSDRASSSSPSPDDAARFADAVASATRVDRDVDAPDDQPAGPPGEGDVEQVSEGTDSAGSEVGPEALLLASQVAAETAEATQGGAVPGDEIADDAAVDPAAVEPQERPEYPPGADPITEPRPDGSENIETGLVGGIDPGSGVQPQAMPTSGQPGDVAAATGPDADGEVDPTPAALEDSAGGALVAEGEPVSAMTAPAGTDAGSPTVSAGADGRPTTRPTGPVAPVSPAGDPLTGPVAPVSPAGDPLTGPV